MPSIATTTSNQLWCFTDTIRDLDLSLEECLREANLPMSCLERADYKVATKWVYQFIYNAAKASGKEDLGWQTGLRVGFSGLQQIGFIALSHSTLNKALKALCNATKQGASHADFFIREEGDYYEFCHVGGVDLEQSGYHYVEQYLLAVMLDLLRCLVGDETFMGAYMRLRTQGFEAANLPDKHMKIRQPYTAIGIPKSLWGAPNPLQIKHSSQSEIEKKHSVVLGVINEVVSDNPFLVNLCEVIYPYLEESVPRLELMASLSGMSVRSLQRYLNKYSLSYTQLVHDLRLAKAQYLIVEEGCSVKEAASKLGYEYPNHLTRAFKDRYGITPKCILS